MKMVDGSHKPYYRGTSLEFDTILRRMATISSSSTKNAADRQRALRDLNNVGNAICNILLMFQSFHYSDNLENPS